MFMVLSAMFLLLDEAKDLFVGSCTGLPSTTSWYILYRIGAGKASANGQICQTNA